MQSDQDINPGTAEHAYHVYGEITDFKNFRGDPMPAFGDLPDKIKAAWANVATQMTTFGVKEVLQVTPSGNPTAESRGLRKQLDFSLQIIKAAKRTSRERSIAITKLQEAIMWLGMDLKAQKEEGIHDGENPYPNSYDPKSDAPISPTADGLKL